MKKLIILSITFLAILIMAAGVYLYFQAIYKPLHQSVSIDDVADIQVYGAGTKMTAVNDRVLTENLIKWFNSATDIRPNKNFAGTTAESGIIINLKSGRGILILRSGKDFEIQRSNTRLKNISYWANQQELKEYLDKLATAEKSLDDSIDDKLDAVVQDPKHAASLNPYDYTKEN